LQLFRILHEYDSSKDQRLLSLYFHWLQIDFGNLAATQILSAKHGPNEITGAEMFNMKGRGMGLAIVAILIGVSGQAGAGDERTLFASLGDTTRAPIGWIEFCSENAGECRGNASQPRDIVMSQAAWRDLLKVNRWVNESVKPMTDMDHWGVIEKWSLPTDGYGDCEDYVLLKRKMLMDAGWPREALLITVVRDRKGEGHAVLTVKTDKGEYVLDNQNENVLAWTETGYRFVKRQSQSDPNVWVSLGDGRPAVATASARER
jgi:predicted transglutaminase-like cysteine proteinase